MDKPSGVMRIFLRNVSHVSHCVRARRFWPLGFKALLCSALLTLPACSLLKPVKVKPVETFTLRAYSQLKFSRHSPKTLLVSAPTASPGYEGINLIYVKKPYQLQYFSHNQWVAPPAQMLSPLIVESLRRSQLFHAVVSSPFSGLTDYRLDVRLLKLQQEFIRKPSQVRLVVQVDLVNAMRNKILASHVFEFLEKAPSDNPYGGVIAANRAVGKLLDKSVRFVASVI